MLAMLRCATLRYTMLRYAALRLLSYPVMCYLIACDAIQYLMHPVFLLKVHASHLCFCGVGRRPALLLISKVATVCVMFWFWSCRHVIPLVIISFSDQMTILFAPFASRVARMSCHLMQSCDLMCPLRVNDILRFQSGFLLSNLGFLGSLQNPLKIYFLSQFRVLGPRAAAF